MELTISQLANSAGVGTATVRHYEREGLLLPNGRNHANYRIYNETSLERIKFIKNAQKLGFSLNEIKQILRLENTSMPFPSALDYLIMRLGDIKNQFSRLANQKENVEKLINICRENKSNAECEFLSYLDSMSVTPTSELVFCRHSYLYDAGYWKLEGNFQLNGSPSVSMTGHVNINHEDNVWHVTRVIELNDSDNTRESIDFYIPPSPREDVEQKFVADCSIFGDVQGSISFAGEDIFKLYEMPEHKVHGHEYLKRLHTDLYEARGVLSDGTKSISWWDYELQRADRSLDS